MRVRNCTAREHMLEIFVVSAEKGESKQKNKKKETKGNLKRVRISLLPADFLIVGF